MRKITKAVIGVAGLASRFLPLTKVIPKPLIGLIDRPIIHYIVEEILEAGVTDIIFVVSRNGHLIREYFEQDEAFEAEFMKRGKKDLVSLLQGTNIKARITLLEQGPEGNGAPILVAEHLLNKEPFLFAFGDDVVKSKEPFSKQLVRAYEKYGTPMMGVQKASQKQIMVCGNVRLQEGTMRILDIIEKPKKEEIKSDLVEFGRMVLTDDIVQMLKRTPIGRGGELWLMDTMKKYIDEGHVVNAQMVEGGEWYTTGDPLNHLKAIVAYALDREDLGVEFREYLEGLLRK